MNIGTLGTLLILTGGCTHVISAAVKYDSRNTHQVEVNVYDINMASPQNGSEWAGRCNDVNVTPQSLGK